MKIRWKVKKIGFKNRIAFIFQNDRLYLTPVIAMMYEKCEDYCINYESISLCIGFTFFWIKFEHKYNIKHE